MPRFTTEQPPLTRRHRRQNRPARRVTALDGLRVLAMLAIVVYHANVKWLPGGFLGVTVFFTLSGYLITDALLREIKRTEGSIDVLGFYKRRLLRLWPLMILVVGASAILCAIFSPSLLAKMRGDAIPALTFWENWYYIVRKQSYFAASGLPSPLTHFWFLSVIVQFYFIWPWVVLLLTRTIPSRRIQARAVGVMALISAVLAAVLFSPSGDPSRVYYGTDTRFAEILIGAWLAFVWPTDGLFGAGKALAERLGGTKNTIVTDILGLLALGAIGWLCRIMNGYSPLLYRGGLLGVSILTAIVIAAIVRPGSLLARPLGLRPLVEVAKRSFGIYLWHYPLLLVMNPATRTTQVPFWGWVLEACVIGLAVELSWRLVEEPIAALFSPKRSASHSADTERRVPEGIPSWVGIVILMVVAGVGGGLTYVGPFWYQDGALLQATDTTQTESTAPVAPTPEAPQGPSLSVSDAINKASEHLQLLLRDTTWTVDPETGVTDAPVILIGDSVPAGAVDQFYEVFPNGYIDAVVGRQLYDAADVYLADQSYGYNQSIVVFSCGDNGVANEDDVVNMVKSAGNRKVYLVTARVPLPLQDMNNELFYTVAANYDNVEVIDWYSWSEGHDEYFWDDGTHLRPEGAEAYVYMLRYCICGE